jgi:alpha-beta hydrolase superfamily lysophospholipase
VYYISDKCKKIDYILLGIHGMAEHGKRYKSFGHYLNSKNILGVFPDLRGHGENVLFNDPPGHIGSNNSFEDIIKDIKILIEQIKQIYPDVPIVLLGHSMGSVIVRLCIAEYGEIISSAIIVATTNGYNPFMRTLGIQLAYRGIKNQGSITVANMLERMSFGQYNKKFKPNRTDFDWICRDEIVVNEYISDPKCGYTSTFGLYYNLLTGIELSLQKKIMKKMPKDLPVLFIAGSHDPVGNFGKEVKQIYQRFIYMDMNYVELIIYPYGRHEILNEINKEEVYEDVINFIKINN